MVSSDNALHLSRTSFVQNRPTTRIKIRWVIDRKTVRSKILKAIRLGMRLMGVLVCSVCCVHHQKDSYCGSVFCWVDRPLFVNGLRRAELRWIQSLKDGKSQSNPKFFAFITGNWFNLILLPVQNIIRVHDHFSQHGFTFHICCLDMQFETSKTCKQHKPTKKAKKNKTSASEP